MLLLWLELTFELAPSPRQGCQSMPHGNILSRAAASIQHPKPPSNFNGHTNTNPPANRHNSTRCSLTNPKPKQTPTNYQIPKWAGSLGHPHPHPPTTLPNPPTAAASPPIDPRANDAGKAGIDFSPVWIRMISWML